MSIFQIIIDYFNKKDIEITNLKKSVIDLQSELSIKDKMIAEAKAIIDKTSDALSISEKKILELLTAINLLKVQKTSKIDLYCQENFKKIPMIAYAQKRDIKGKKYSIALNELITPDSYEVIKLMKGISRSDNLNQDAKNVGNKIAKYLTWDSDNNLDSSGDYYLYPNESIARKKCDCFAGYEEIYTENGITQIRDIKVGDNVLSYDFDKKEYVYKKVVKHWSKGELQINRVFFRNGQHVDLSADHPMWIKDHKTGKFKKQLLSEVNLDSWKDKKVPVTLRLPYKNSDPKFHIDLYKVIGHFLAEGWISKSSVHSSGHELIDYIIPLLEKHNIPFSESINNSGVPTINFLKSDFKDYLKTLKTNSFDIHLDEHILRLPEDYLEEFIYGAWLGDGTKNTGTGRNADRWVYSTSSEQFANDIVRIMQYLGRPLHLWKQENHKGAGNKPIYRLTFNPKSHFLIEKEYKGLSETSIIRIEKLEDTEMFDITVEDTSTVILKNGLITHQCEDHSFVVASTNVEFGICWGFLNRGNEHIGHAFNCFIYNDTLYTLDTTGNSVDIKKWDVNNTSDSNYEIYFIITKENAYRVKSGVSFGEMAGW